VRAGGGRAGSRTPGERTLYRDGARSSTLNFLALALQRGGCHSYVVWLLHARPRWVAGREAGGVTGGKRYLCGRRDYPTDGATVYLAALSRITRWVSASRRVTVRIRTFSRRIAVVLRIVPGGAAGVTSSVGRFAWIGRVIGIRCLEGRDWR
jgi:hypothetical protein